MILNGQASIKKNNYNKTKHALVEKELKSCKWLIQIILKVKIILKNMVPKLFSISANIQIF